MVRPHPSPPLHPDPPPPICADLPVFLQMLRGCYGLQRLSISGNPITEERKFRSYLSKATPSLEVIDGEGVVRPRKYHLPEVVSTSNVYVTCLRQIKEQDELKEQHRLNMEYVSHVTPCVGHVTLCVLVM